QHEITEKINGKVWEFTCDSRKVLEIMNRLRVSNVVSMGEKSKIRAVCDEKPAENAENVTPDLEDVCLYSFGEL
ncbi:MAG: multidrug ABC transporter ATP-binding protein, partial [Ruminococcus sp.]|nr:multidrug ABC transporter ATP-binding protein [Ruminococcus sp.]